MELLCFLIFFLLTVIKSFSKPIKEPKPLNKDGEGLRISCSEQYYWLEVPANHFDVDLQPDYFHSVRSCLTVTGRPWDCEMSGESFLRFEIHPFGFTDVPIHLGAFDFSDEWCHTLTAKDMAELVEGKINGKNMNAVVMSVWAYIYGKEDPEVHYNLNTRAAPYYIDAPGSFDKHDDPNQLHKMHSVICRLPGCIVTAEGVDKIQTQKFHIMASGEPKFEPAPGPLTADMFSVSDLYCFWECPPKFTATKVEIAGNEENPGEVEVSSNPLP